MAVALENSKRIEEAQKISKKEPRKAEAIYKDVLSNGPGQGEVALMSLGELYRDGKQANELGELVKKSCSSLSKFAKAKTAKLGLFLVFNSCLL
jgi:hypothetical protein